MENQKWFLLHDNAPAHRSVLVKDFLAKNNVTTLQHPPHSPDLAPTDFTFRPLKPALKVRRFCEASDIFKNAMTELKRFHKMTSRNVSDTFTVSGRSVCLHKGNNLKEI